MGQEHALELVKDGAGETMLLIAADGLQAIGRRLRAIESAVRPIPCGRATIRRRRNTIGSRRPGARRMRQRVILTASFAGVGCSVARVGSTISVAR
jgi:hypothetical protein